jgi:hypothetical protein
MRLLLLTFSGVLWAGAISAEEKPADTLSRPMTAEEKTELIRKYVGMHASEDPKQREEAQRALANLGDEAVKAVAGAIERGDIVQRRLEETLRVLRDLELTPEEKSIQASHRRIRMTLEFQQQPFREVMEFMRQFANMNYIIDADSGQNDRKLTLKVVNLPMENVLNLVTEQVGYTWVIEDGHILFTSEEKVKSRRWILARKYGDRRVDPKDPDIVAMQNKLDNLKIDLDFREAKMEDALEFVRALGGLNVAFDKSVLDDGSVMQRNVTYKVKQRVLGDCLRQVLDAVGLEYGFRERVIYVTKKEPVK